ESGPGLSGQRGGDLAAEVAVRLESRSGLPERVQAERLQALLRRLGLDADGLATLATRARILTPALRNTIAAFLPPAERRGLLSGTRATPSAAAAVGRPSPGSGGTSSSSKGEEAPVRPPSRVNMLQPIGEPVGISDRYGTVVLLSKPMHQEANKRLLLGRDLGPLVWDSLEKLESDLGRNADVCACIIDQTFLQDLDVVGQRRLFEVVAGYSTFLWIRVHDGPHLQLSQEEVRRIVRSAWCLRSSVPSESLSFQPDAHLRESELGDIGRASDVLRSHARTQFFPGELTSEQGQLLVAAARLQAQELRLDGEPVVVGALETRFLQGGYSETRVAAVRINQGGRPIVAKIATKERIRDEIRRFRAFIEAWDDKLRPQAYFHGSAAVVLFGLVPDADDPRRPAPMLEEQLTELWNAQLFGSDPASALDVRAATLASGIADAARSLRELNAQSPARADFPSVANPDVSLFDRLDIAGVDWGFSESAREARARATQRFARLAHAAVVHGDVHLRNILMRRQSEPHLIDYAGSGPGHPAVDLVRLELALYLGVSRQVEPEDQCISFQRALSIELASCSDLAAAFPAFHRCHVNVACARGCVASRDEAICALRAHGGAHEDYIAAKYLVAWQNLIMPGRHTGLARAVVAALTPVIANW
ncbi:MAG TPA: phosphotransferase, partial [Acidobacteriaceae bacterium]|nr:phosphotransferase [Acidobacteriaceae bacterium]